MFSHRQVGFINQYIHINHLNVMDRTTPAAVMLAVIPYQPVMLGESLGRDVFQR